ncbi:MAG: hypothetical protein GWN84_07380 [Gammaproteobacteria bacterium]|nr:hypothetical protein [Gammaproteobacteria bacterium]NIR82705.1 hypothetical protein [Gammaproteobacteria bacterium]NIR89569.1 hypothetical protein [Gammaproteobacteria bacterium]NIU03865.1 hypothetical protein [Gammaproteobacteria bacterium]NIX85139.1 hypothetical protein [Gammaproteobacteria bacterium]
MRDREAHPHNDQPAEPRRTEGERLTELLDLAVSLRRDALDEITARVAHEIKQPLSVIVSNVRGAARRLEANQPADTRILQALDKAAAQAKRAAQVVERARAELGVERVAREPFDVGRIVRAALCIAVPLAAMRDVRLEAAVDDRPLPALGDPQRLKHALLVLVLEGIDGIQADRGRVPVLSLGATGRGATIEITLCYRGGAAHPAAKAASRSLSAPAPACDTGLGLSFVRSVVEAHGGGLAVLDGQRGERASVHIGLPSAKTYDGTEQ